MRLQPVFAVLLLVAIVFYYRQCLSSFIKENREQLIFVITPTYRRHARLPDLTRMANTLMHVSNLHWVVIEDSERRVPAVERILNESLIPYTYIPAKTRPGVPKSGWYQRDTALRYLWENGDRLSDGRRSVIFFGDDDNSYSLHLFNDYIRNVKVAGVWAVGLVGGVMVESPAVLNGKVVGWHVKWNPKRKFSIDMAGFAVSLDVARKSRAQFGTSCKRGGGAPETCFLEDCNLTLSDLEPFGFDKQGFRDVLVWHTKTTSLRYDKTKQDLYGFLVE